MSIPGYQPHFEAAFPGQSDPITYNNVGQAIGGFERRLMTPGRFDNFLARDETALTEREQQGLALFIQTGCIACHYGPALGGNSYATLGAQEPSTPMTPAHATPKTTRSQAFWKSLASSSRLNHP